MARRLCQFLFTLAVLYALAVGAFALFHYDGTRPDVLTIAGDMHEWISARFRSSTPKPAEPGTIPPKRTDVVEPPPPPPPPRLPPPPTDARSRAITEVRDEILPKATEVIARMDDKGAKVQELKVEARVILVKGRDLLGALLDEKADDPEVQRLNKKVTDLLIAVDKR